MPIKLSQPDADFKKRFVAFVANPRGEAEDVAQAVSEIIAAVRARGDAALLEYTKRFDDAQFMAGKFKVSRPELEEAEENCPPDVREALAVAAERVQNYHEKQLPADMQYVDAAGVTLGNRWSAITDVGMYVPGGKASYPSSVLMNAIPAKVAGVHRLVMAVPAPHGALNPAVLVAAKLAGVDEIYRIGGAQAVAALAFGTETIRPVHKIVGPGNAYVAEAKRQVFGTVGIDMIAGPSEILVLADNKNHPRWIAADLLSQAEHDVDAQSILITDDADFAHKVEREIEHILESLPRAAIAGQSWLHRGAVIIVNTLEEAAPLIDALAPEHLELAIDDAETYAKRIHHAGAIFLGRHTPEAAGDYLAGPSHVLPTSRTARFSSVLSVQDFMKRSSIIGCSEKAIKALIPSGRTLAESEGLHAHALSLKVRE